MDDNKVAVLLENLQSQFRVFGEGLQMLNEKVDTGFQELKNDINALKYEVGNLKGENRREHQQLMQMIKELDTEVVRLKVAK